jgi:hypothetical protein
MADLVHVPGSEAWVEHVYSTPPYRRVKGRTRWTFRHGPFVPELDRFAYVESGHEFIALLALRHLFHRGAIRRFKEQPYAFRNELHGFDHVPDFAVERREGLPCLIEVKAKRYLTRQLERDLERIGEKLAKHNLTYLVWTDKAPLSRWVRKNLLWMHKASVEAIPNAEKLELLTKLRSRGTLYMEEITDLGFDLFGILSLCWSGLAHFQMSEDIGARTRFSALGSDAFEQLLFNSKPNVSEWWASLEVA